jgi:hypothetical protein
MKSVEEIAADILFQDVREVFDDPFGERRDGLLKARIVQALMDQARSVREAALAEGRERGYADGVAAAVQVAGSLKVNVWWEANATPNDGLRHGIEAVRYALVEFLSRVPATEEVEDG